MRHGHSGIPSGADPGRPDRSEELITELALRTVAADRYRVIEAYGEIDIANAGELSGVVDSCVASGADRLIVDLSGVRFVDSSGLNVLIGTARRFRTGSFGVVVSRPSIRKIFAITGLDKVVPIFASVTDARQALEADTGSADSCPPGPASILEAN
jgi:anti-sigma B factor antagonist